MFGMMKAMTTAAAVVTVCGLAASLFLGVPIKSMMHSAGDGIMEMAGPSVTADSVRELIAQSKEQIAKTTPAIERIKRQAEALEREQGALEHDVPAMKTKLERMLTTLDRAGDARIVQVNGAAYPRGHVEADIQGAMAEYEMAQGRLLQLPAEREALDRQVQRLDRERAEAWGRIAAMEREVSQLESRGAVAAATKQASELTVHEVGSLSRQMARLRDMVESAEALCQAGRPGSPTMIDWDGAEGLYMQAAKLGLNVPARRTETAGAPVGPSITSRLDASDHGG